jgi:formate dehydrogenase major subunit
VVFELDGQQVQARQGETIWQVAKRLGTDIPHLCYQPEPGYRPDGNCRACMVEIEGERVLARLCMRKPRVGMKVKSPASAPPKAQKMVMELLVTDQPARATSHDPTSKFWGWAEKTGSRRAAFPAAERWATDASHPGHAGQPRCLHPVRAVRARLPRGAGQRRDRHGLPQCRRQAGLRLRRPDGRVHLRVCGECVQACPTGALMPAAYLDDNQVRTVYPERKVDSLCPYCGVGCQVTYNVVDEKIVYAEGRDGPANKKRLCVKGRFGFDYIHHPHRLTAPLVRLPGLRSTRMIKSIRPIRGRISARRAGMRRLNLQPVG